MLEKSKVSCEATACRGRMVAENIIPVMFSRAEVADSGVKSDDLLSDGIAGWVGVEAAVDGTGLRQQCGEPSWVGSSSGCGYAERRGMQEKATYGIDGGFAEHDHGSAGSGDGKIAEIFLRTRRHTAPTSRSRAAQFGAGGPVFFSKQ